MQIIQLAHLGCGLVWRAIALIALIALIAHGPGMDPLMSSTLLRVKRSDEAKASNPPLQYNCASSAPGWHLPFCTRDQLHWIVWPSQFKGCRILQITSY